MFCSSKNQQAVRDICDQVLGGQGVSFLTVPKLRKLMEDESLRCIACAKLNYHLREKKHFAEDEFLDDVVSNMESLIPFEYIGRFMGLLCSKLVEQSGKEPCGFFNVVFKD